MAPRSQPDALSETADPRLYVPRTESECALGALEAFLETRGDARRIALLRGPSGLGKTLLLKVLQERASAGRRVVFSPFLHFPPGEASRWLLTQLGMRGVVADPSTALARLLAARCEPPLLLILDEAQAIPVETADFLGGLVARADPRLRVVMAGLAGRTLRHVASALGVPLLEVDLAAPLDDAEMSELLDAALAHADFEPAARALLGRTDPQALLRAAGTNPLHLRALLVRIACGLRSEPIVARSGGEAIARELAASAPPTSGRDVAEASAPPASAASSAAGAPPIAPAPIAPAAGHAEAAAGARVDPLAGQGPSVAALARPPRAAVAAAPRAASGRARERGRAARRRLLRGARALAAMTRREVQRLAAATRREALRLAVGTRREVQRLAAAVTRGATAVEAAFHWLATRPRPPAGTLRRIALALGLVAAVAFGAAHPPSDPLPAVSSAPPVALDPVTIQVNAHPWALIRLDGVDLGPTPLSRAGLDAGEHRLEAVFPDGRRAARTVEVGPDARSFSFR